MPPVKAGGIFMSSNGNKWTNPVLAERVDDAGRMTGLFELFELPIHDATILSTITI